MPTDLSDRVFRETRRAVDRFGKYSEKEVRRIKNIYIGARKRISGEIAEQWPDVVKSGTTPFGMERLRGLQLSIDTQLGALNQDLNAVIPQMVGDAGDMGIYRGQVELAQLLREFPDIHPTFGVLNTSAIDVYSGYALQLSQQYTAELTRQIQSALQMGLIDQKTTGQLTTQIRQYLGAEFGKPAKAITYKAQRIARTEMSRAYQAGHEAYGRSTDFIVGEVAHHNPMGPWPCAQCENIPEGTEFIYAAGDAPPYPLHPNCKCYTTYIYSKKLFTKEEMGKLRGMTPEAPGPSKPIGRVPTGVPKGKVPKGRVPSRVKGKVPKVEPLTYEGSMNSESKRILRSGLRTKTEHGVAVDTKGKVVMKRPGKSPDMVTLTPDDMEKMRLGKAKGFIHNHPGESASSFSPDDLNFARTMDLDEMMVVGKKYKYTIKQGSRGWQTADLDELGKLYDSAIKATTSKYEALYKADVMMDWEEMWARQTHEVIEGLSKKFGLIYKRSVM